MKAALRKEIIVRRDAMMPGEVQEKSRHIVKRISDDQRFLDAKSIAVYLPKGNEVDLSALIEKAIGLGKEILVPVTDHKITFYRFTSFDDLGPGKFGILEPKTKTPPKHPEPDLILVPGVCFGQCMHRIGYGRGYYDKYLKHSKAYRMGVCFDFQVHEKLPAHEEDVPLDEIVTEKRVILAKRER